MIVGDGARDCAMLPRLVETILAASGEEVVVDSESRS